MKYLVLFLVFKQIYGQFHLVAPYLNITCNDVCRCFDNDTITCPAAVKVEVEPDYNYFITFQKVTIICPESQDPSILAGIRFPEFQNYTVEIQGCYLHKSSIFELLANMGVRDFHVLYIISYGGGFHRKLFENLDKVLRLQISQSNLGVLPVDIFKELTNLSDLAIYNSSFTLTKGVFEYTPKLKSIDLDINDVLDIHYEVFNSLKVLNSLKIVGTNKTTFIFDLSKKFIARGLSTITLSSLRITPTFLDSQRKPPVVEDSTENSQKVLGQLPTHTRQMSELELTSDITATIFKLPPEFFAHMDSLRKVTLSAIELCFVSEDAFLGSKDIESIDFSYNLIRTLGERTFWDLESLQELDLRKNRISHLPELLLSRTKSLKYLHLSYNQLETVKPNVFSNLTELTSLDLSNNKLRHISGEEFSHLKRLTTIDLSHNQLISLALDPLLRDLDYSVLYNCTELTYLFVEHNYLTEMYDDWRLQLTRLAVIDMSHNEVIQTPKMAYDLVLAKNIEGQMTIEEYINNYAIKNDEPDWLISINISNSFVDCNCDLLTFLYNRSDMRFYKEQTFINSAKCKTPKRLENVKIVDIRNLSREYDICKELLAEEDARVCPEGCRCVYRPLTRSSVVNCQYLDLQSYPRTLPVAPDANHTELILYGNKLLEFRMPDDPGYKNVTYLNLANNLLSTLDIRGVSRRLKKLDLSHNRLKTLTEEALRLLEDSLELERLELENNPWTCDISNVGLAQLVFNKQHMIRRPVRCEDGSPLVNLLDLYKSTRLRMIIYTVSGAVGTLSTAVLVLTVLYYRNRQKVLVYCFSSRWKLLRWLISHPDVDDDDKIYDAFVVFAHEDEMFVVNHLVPYLEQTEERKYKLCLHYRDWIPGEQIVMQIGRSVRSSRRTIVVLSPNFLLSVWGVTEFRMAHAEALRDGTARVIVILYQDVSDEEVDEELKAYLQTNTYVQWDSPWFWKQLTYALPHPPDRTMPHFITSLCEEETYVTYMTAILTR